jgi:hypothetical protein
MRLPGGVLALTAAILIVPAGFTIGRAQRAVDRPAAIQGRTVDEWLAALKNPDPAARRRAVEILGERALDPTIPPDEASHLQTAVGALLFTDEDEGVRRAVASFADRARGSAPAGNEAQVAEDRRVARRDQLKRLRDSYGELLRRKRETFRKLAEAIGSDARQTYALRQQYAMEHLHYLQKELLDLQSQKRKLEAQLRVMPPAERGESGEQPLSDKEIDRRVEQHPTVVELASRLAECQRKLDARAAMTKRISRDPSADPLFKALTRDVEEARQALDRRRREVRPEVIRQAQQAAEGSRAAEIRRELAMLVDLQQRLKKEIEAAETVNHSLAVRVLDLESLREEIAQMQAVADRIGQELEALDTRPKAPTPAPPAGDPPAPR